MILFELDDSWSTGMSVICSGGIETMYHKSKSYIMLGQPPHSLIIPVIKNRENQGQYIARGTIRQEGNHKVLIEEDDGSEDALVLVCPPVLQQGSVVITGDREYFEIFSHGKCRARRQSPWVIGHPVCEQCGETLKSYQYKLKTKKISYVYQYPITWDTARFKGWHALVIMKEGDILRIRTQYPDNNSELFYLYGRHAGYNVGEHMKMSRYTLEQRIKHPWED